MSSRFICFLLKGLFLLSFTTAWSLTLSFSLSAQEKPPRPISVRVSTAQHLSFGPIIPTGADGKVTVTFNGFRTATGNVILPYISAIISPALFIVDAEPGTLINIVNGPNVQLSGSNGGTLILELGESSTGSPFITTGTTTDVFIGGTLTVKSLLANPAGNYIGSFQVTFIQQ
jgi:hypothetical protein